MTTYAYPLPVSPAADVRDPWDELMDAARDCANLYRRTAPRPDPLPFDPPPAVQDRSWYATREAVYGFIAAHPGCDKHAITADLGRTLTTVENVVRRLEKKKRIHTGTAVIADRRRTVYFANPEGE
jgi:hypothetical protein